MLKQLEGNKLIFLRGDSTASSRPNYEGTSEVINLSSIMKNNLLVVNEAPINYDIPPVKAPERPKTQDK